MAAARFHDHGNRFADRHCAFAEAAAAPVVKEASPEETRPEDAKPEHIKPGQSKTGQSKAANAEVEAATAVEDADRFSVFDAEETVVDESALRELIATIIREELQGALGERITRNVRKLVRSEIHRALTSREFE